MMKKLCIILAVLILGVTAVNTFAAGSETWSFNYTNADGVTTPMTVSSYYKPNPTQNSAIVGADGLWTGANYYTTAGDDLSGLTPSTVGSDNEGAGIINRGCTPQSIEAFDGRGGTFLNLVNPAPALKDENYRASDGKTWADGINDHGQGFDLRNGYKMVNNNNDLVKVWKMTDDSASKSGVMDPFQLQESQGNNRYTSGYTLDSKDHPGDRKADDLLVTISGFNAGQTVLLSVVSMANAAKTNLEDFSWGTLADGAAVNAVITNTGTMLFPAGNGYSDVAFACDIGNFTADGLGKIQLYLGENWISQADEGGLRRTQLDGIFVIPEPATMMLLGLGTLLLRRRK
jgi:hypothetical protein